MACKCGLFVHMKIIGMLVASTGVLFFLSRCQLLWWPKIIYSKLIEILRKLQHWFFLIEKCLLQGNPIREKRWPRELNITSEGSCVVRWDVLIRVKTAWLGTARNWSSQCCGYKFYPPSIAYGVVDTYAEPSDKFFMVRPVMFALWSENWSFVRLKTLLRTLAKKYWPITCPW